MTELFKAKKAIKANKKGSIMDMVFLVLLLIVVGTTLIVGNAVFKRVYSQMLNETSIITPNSTAANILEDNQAKLPRLYDTIMMWGLFGVGLAAIIGAFLVRTHPVVFFATIFMMMILSVLLVVVEGYVEGLEQDSIVVDSLADMPKTQYILDHAVTFLFGLWIAILFAMFIGGYS